ncbi:hypothetical protein LZD49_34160 [Dyadobacter sp. CY261]|uniref:hypothetical protein n=1 Tax=Dyadobacter sp. CY261 TaxID=2907203 RepID=UPI001F3307F8|nr:hypothetical protein [Dyadobacter sp. CY261]MCF0075569.1 hypothetical protein [Dyadobacter sp. CY261]
MSVSSETKLNLLIRDWPAGTVAVTSWLNKQGYSKPDWSIYDFEKFPSIQWKLRNLTILKKNNPGKHREQFEILEEKLKIEKRGV